MITYHALLASIDWDKTLESSGKPVCYRLNVQAFTPCWRTELELAQMGVFKPTEVTS
jgi:hypothetical protein